MKNILIANRSEIARRVIRSAKENGYTTTALYSPHDASALHAREATRSFALKGNTPKESYLDQEQVLRAIKESGADAVHPGYGFLSENADFVRLLDKNKITFIGPKADAMELLGDKTKARTLARKLGVPTPEGTTSAITSDKEAIKTAAEVGYPILLKAAAGGGGKGMRIVEKESELLQNLERARGEALGAFGDDRVYIEKYIVRPRHIEIQILADQHGNVVYLGERECSIQRRHQKLIEEAPSVAVSAELRKQMGEAAVTLIREAKYFGAATVEFLLDASGKFYFLEVNTRLQVEHPVTEFITGLDLVREQFRIAEGEKLKFAQKDVQFRGHSIEVRIQAEDVWNDFLPSLGTITHVRHPGGAFVRNDSAMFAGLEVSGFYDSLLSKLIVWDMDRESAIKRMARALDESIVAGVGTTLPFAQFCMESKVFGKGDLSTAFVSEEFSGEKVQERYNFEQTGMLPWLTATQQKLIAEKERKKFVSI